MTNMIALRVNDGTTMNAYISMPSGEGKFPGVIVFQEAFGVNNHIKDVADRIAAEGYVTIAPELFHRTAKAGEEFSYNDFPSVMPHYQALNTDTLIADAKACYDWLQLQENVITEKIGCIGFCLGGKAAFVANTGLPLAASVAFYGGGMHLEAGRASLLSGPQLLFWGGKDAHITQEHIQTVVDAIKHAGKDYINVEISYAPHAFFCDARPAYQPQAAAEAWGMTKAFLKNKLG